MKTFWLRIYTATNLISYYLPVLLEAYSHIRITWITLSYQVDSIFDRLRPKWHFLQLQTDSRKREKLTPKCGWQFDLELGTVAHYCTLNYIPKTFSTRNRAITTHDGRVAIKGLVFSIMWLINRIRWFLFQFLAIGFKVTLWCCDELGNDHKNVISYEISVQFCSVLHFQITILDDLLLSHLLLK